MSRIGLAATTVPAVGGGGVAAVLTETAPAQTVLAP
jgi:hypothetical protein